MKGSNGSCEASNFGIYYAIWCPLNLCSSIQLRLLLIITVLWPKAALFLNSQQDLNISPHDKIFVKSFNPGIPTPQFPSFDSEHSVTLPLEKMIIFAGFSHALAVTTLSNCGMFFADPTVLLRFWTFKLCTKYLNISLSVPSSEGWKS